MSGSSDLTKRVILVGVGGASCSGKTTLAKHLQRLIPESFIIHQDDFNLPEEQIPLHPVLGIKDWDDARGAIDWSHMTQVLQGVKQTGEVPPEHSSHDHLNAQDEIPILDTGVSSLTKKFEEMSSVCRMKGLQIIWGIIDGFLLYWHPDIVSLLDVRIFLRVPYRTIKERREARPGYYTAEGTLWCDPPGYWDDIVWPAYSRAHIGLFIDGNLETGGLAKTTLQTFAAAETSSERSINEADPTCGGPVDRLRLFEASEHQLAGLLEKVVDRVLADAPTD